VAGIDLMDTILARSTESGWRVFFLGSEQGVVEEAVWREPRARERERHEGLVVAAYRNEYWTPDEEFDVVRRHGRRPT
jgi:N-acetylglucosaminyldiphosphoundecaprenol N-acetyl-beta-D-mannosaminyltransferase